MGLNQTNAEGEDRNEATNAIKGQQQALAADAGVTSNGGPPVVMLAEEVLQEDLKELPESIALIPDVPLSDVDTMDTAKLLELGQKVLDALRALHVQTHIDGMNNIWIVKPAALSRGRGIRLFNNLEQLFSYIKGASLTNIQAGVSKMCPRDAFSSNYLA